jgi:hypothetical protein
MDHPEQALFDEVKGLRSQMEEVRDRIFKIENVYINKVENTERREYTSKVIDNKLIAYKENLKTKKIVVVDNRYVPIFKDTVFTNVYKSPKLMSLWDSDKTEIIYDMDYDYFMAVMDIVRRGHNIEMLDKEDKNALQRNFKLRSKELDKDIVFAEILKTFFNDHESFSTLIIDYNLNFGSIPSDLSNIVESIKYLDGTLTNLVAHDIGETKNFNEIFNVKNEKAIFLDYNKNAVVELTMTVRAKTIYLRPFTKDTGVFYPTTGASYARIYISNDYKEWDLIGTLPSDYGSASNDYICPMVLGKFKSFKYIKFNTNGSAQLSVSYIKLE